MTDTCEKHCEANAFKIVIRGLEGEVARLKERLAQEKALQALHNENERLGLYKDAYVEQEPLIGCVNHDCDKCKERTEQEPDYWLGYGLQAHTEKPFENATALYKDPPQRTEQNFCSRCGKRTPDLITIHTCTPPKENT